MEPLASLGMRSIMRRVKDSLGRQIKKLFEVEEEVTLMSITNKMDFEYNCPQALKLFNNYKKDGKAFGFASADEIAKKIVAELPKEDDTIEKLGTLPGGMMTVTIKDKLVEEGITNVVKQQELKIGDQTKKKFIVDFSSPNIAKEMHVGHLRSTIIGESTCRILEFLGNDVARINHVGDWGTQFGMLIEHLRTTYPDYKTNTPKLKDLETFYKESKKRFDDDPEFKTKSQLNVVALQSGDAEYLKLWEAICDLSRAEYNKIYSRLGANIKEMGESFYNPLIPGVIKELEDKGLVKIDQGAKCVFIEGLPNPLMIQKSDGGFNYDSTDMAALKYRIQEMKGDRLIYITDAGQEPHFRLVFEAGKLANWYKPSEIRIDHMGFGVVQGEDGKKFKTRSGDIVKLMDLLDEAKERAEDDLKKRLEEQKDSNKTSLTPTEISEAAEKIGVAAIKYFDLRQNRISTYRFSYDKMLDPKGNTAVYLLYSYARICSILRKSGLSQEKIKELAETKGFKITHPHERYLAIALLRFPEVLDTVVDELMIHKLCDLIYDIATKIAEGYGKFRILDDPNTETRLILCEATRKILHKAFYLVGIDPLEKI